METRIRSSCCFVLSFRVLKERLERRSDGLVVAGPPLT